MTTALSGARRPLPRGVTVVSALLLLAAALLASSSPAAAQDRSTSIHGRVVNGTPGGTVPDGFQVVLLTVDDETGRIMERTTTGVAADGAFSFEGALRSPGVSLRLVTVYNEVTEAQKLNPDDPWDDIDLTIHETTTSFEDIRVTSYGLAIPTLVARERLLGALGSIELANTGDRTVIPDLDALPPALLRFALPHGYTDLVIESDLGAINAQAIAEGFALLDPIPPGDHFVLFQYLMSYEGDTLELPVSFLYGADELHVLLKEEFGTIEVDGAPASDVAVLDEASYLLAEGTGYEPGATATVLLEGLPGPTFVESVVDFFRGNTLVIVVAWLGGGGMLVMLAYAFIWQRNRQPESAWDRRRLVQEIAHLDERHQAGEISESEYGGRRGELKARALALAPTSERSAPADGD